MIPDGWREIKLGDICDFQHGYGFRPPDWSSDGIPIIRIQNLNGSREFNYFNGVPEKEWIVEPGTLLFAWAGTKGVSFGPTIWGGPLGLLNQHIYRVVPKVDVNLLWLFSALQIVTSRIESNAHGFKSTLLHVRKADITDQKILLPPLPEQRAIAAILSTCDEAITLTERLIAALEQRKRALMDVLLTGEVRFKEFEDADWVEIAFREFLNESRIKGNHGGVARKITVRLHGKGVIAKDETLAGSKNTQYYIRKAEQFIYSKLDFLNGAFGIVPEELDGYESTLDLPAFDLDLTQINPNYLLNYVTRQGFYKSKFGLAKGGRKARRVSPEALLSTLIDLPALGEQDKISETLTLCDRLVTLYGRVLKQTSEQKRGLMQQLLTGAIRVQGIE